MNKYRELKERQHKEMNSFPMAFAFSDSQFQEGMRKLGLDPNDTDKVCSIGGGGFILKTDAKALTELINRHGEEMQAEIDADLTGDGFIKDMFIYELANHEYCITYDYEDTLDALDLTLEQVLNTPKLKHGLAVARKEYLANCEDY